MLVEVRARKFTSGLLATISSECFSIFLNPDLVESVHTCKRTIAPAVDMPDVFTMIGMASGERILTDKPIAEVVQMIEALQAAKKP